MMHRLLPIVLGAVAASTAMARTYTINQFTVDGGGGGLVGAAYTLDGTIGQPDAGSMLSGAAYQLRGGFWRAPTMSPLCQGDADGDGFVNFNDLNLVLANWGGPGPGGDVDDSGAVNFDDLNIVLANWAGDC